MTKPDKRVAVLSPIAWRTPPRQYGAWETVASNITEELVARGWDVTLLASRDSKDGQTGFLVDNVTEAVRSLGRISEIDRRACRNRVRQYFSIDTMVEGYERVYSTIFDVEAKRQP